MEKNYITAWRIAEKMEAFDAYAEDMTSAAEWILKREGV